MNTEISDTTIFIPNGDHDIPARIEMPGSATRENKVPAAVILHGTGTNKDEIGGSYRRLAKMMAREGIASIRIDFLGHGESTGSLKDFTFASARSDLLKATDHIRQLDGVDRDRIGIIGWSQGGGHAYLAAANEPGYSSVVTWACGAEWPLSMLIPPGAREEAERNGFAVVIDEKWNNSVRYMNFQWIKEVESLDIRQEVSKIDAPVLAIVGTENFMTVEDIQKTIKACKNQNSKMYVIEGGNHTFNVFNNDFTAPTYDTRVFYQAADATVKWLQETL